MKNYIAFAWRNLRFIGFGLLLCFASSAGQTFFVGIFGPSIRTEFGLNHTDWGVLYLFGTLASAALLPWSGQLLDRLDLRIFTAAVLFGLALACAVISLTSAVWFIAVAIFLLRQFGQGLSSLTGTTSMARYFDAGRGKAIALASTGFSFGEALLPVSAVIIIATVGWREAYQLTSIAVLLLIPLALWLLRGHPQRHTAHLSSLQDSLASSDETQHYTRRKMLGERRFYLMLPALLAPSFVLTALFFHHLTLAEYKGWSATWVTGNYWLYALLTIATSLLVGPLIDRVSAARIMPLFLLPLVAALLVIGFAEQDWQLLPYFALLGINTGIHHTGSAAMWAELYGARYLGAIKSLMVALSVFASALGPVTVGLMLDSGLSMATVCYSFALACLLATLMLLRALPVRRAQVISA